MIMKLERFTFSSKLLLNLRLLKKMKLSAEILSFHQYIARISNIFTCMTNKSLNNLSQPRKKLKAHVDF